MHAVKDVYPFHRQVENGAPFHAHRDLRMDIVVEAREHRDATASKERSKAIILVDVTYADLQAGIHVRTGDADRDGSAAYPSEARSHNHHVHPGQVCPSTSAATN